MPVRDAAFEQAKAQILIERAQLDSQMRALEAGALARCRHQEHTMKRWWRGTRQRRYYGWARATCKHCGCTVEVCTYRDKPPMEGDALTTRCSKQVAK